MSRHSDHFGYTAVRSEGGMLPYELLEQIGAHSSELGITSTAYYLAEHEPLSEAQSRAWLRLGGLWKRFAAARSRLPKEDPAIRLTRERWLLPLFQELGYGRLATAKDSADLIVDGRDFPISHMHTCVPIHLMGAGVDIDRRAPKIAGAIHSSPHGLVQDFLNRSELHLWGIVSNGLRLRLLRDSHTFTRRPHLEFDIEAIFDGDLYSDFRLLWLCTHASRLSPAGEASKRPDSAPMENWFQRAKSEGTRVRDRLRDSVKWAIERLGSGFLRHPANLELHRLLANGELTLQGYYRELLRLIYRLIFVFVAEDRGVLQPPIQTDIEPESARARHQAQQRYIKYYATANLRELVRRRRGDHYGDRWAALRLVLTKLHRGCTKLDLPAFGSALFRPDATPHLHEAELANADLLAALHELCTFIDKGRVTRPISWRHIGTDELGSVFEFLLELEPIIHRESATFTLKTVHGNERKTTGSYYTPEPLVECLLDSALDPVLDRACAEPNAEKALLDLKVCDPACGSGHFLAAAGRRIAQRVAQMRAGDDEPSPHVLRRALRDVYARCLFGVDINPLTVELCKVSLWIESIEPECALPFLDAHILQGNSLLGATPALIAGGIPDEAFSPIEGDDKESAARLRNRNRNERAGKAQGVPRGLFPRAEVGAPSIPDHGQHRSLAEAIEAMPGDTFAATEAKEALYKSHVSSSDAHALRLLADVWCAAFVWPKDHAHEDSAPTHWLFERIREDPTQAPEETVATVTVLARDYDFFHWQFAFPQVFSVVENGATEQSTCGWGGGFDVVLGNPPWERIKLQKKEYFTTRSQAIAEAKNASVRKKLIGDLPQNEPELWGMWQAAFRKAMGESYLVRATGRYPLCGRGDINTYSVFAELDEQLVRGPGRIGYIAPAGIAMDETTRLYFASLVNGRRLSSLYHFENGNPMFPDIHRSIRFCLLTILGSDGRADAADFVAFARQPVDLLDSERHYRLALDDLERMNPNTRSLPTFRMARDASINLSIYRRVPVLFVDGMVGGNSWGIRFKRMFDMANDSGRFFAQDALQCDEMGWATPHAHSLGEFLPLYEAKMIHSFDHRFGTYEGQTYAQANQGVLPRLDAVRHLDPFAFPLSRYWVRKRDVKAKLGEWWDRPWLFGWRDVCRTSDRRTLICSAVPLTAVGSKLPLLLPAVPLSGLLMANLSSFVVDYAARQKIGGASLSIFIIKQLPILPPAAYDAATPWHPTTTLAEWILPRVLELTYTAWDLIGFARDHGYDGPPFRWDEERRFWLRAELDAAYFHLYGLTLEEVDHVMESFRLVRQRDEKVQGNYRTKLAILDLYQRMASAGPKAPYQTVLDPPPADPSVAHPPLTKAQAEELAPIIERALAAPSPGSGVSAEAIVAKRKPTSRAKAPASKLAATTQINLGIHASAPRTNAAKRPAASVAANATPTAALVDPPSIQHLIALEDPSITLEMLAVLRALHRAGGAQSKAQLVEATELEIKACTATLATLLDTGMLEQQGRGRGTKYQLVK